MGGHRGIADISMDGSPCSPARAYTGTARPPRQDPGWVTVSGTSVAAPLFAGLVADAAQHAGHPLGVLGPALYQLHGTADGIGDITGGSDAMPGRPGWPARPGYDLPSGIGTISAALPFIIALARASGPGLAGSRSEPGGVQPAAFAGGAAAVPGTRDHADLGAR